MESDSWQLAGPATRSSDVLRFQCDLRAENCRPHLSRIAGRHRFRGDALLSALPGLRFQYLQELRDHQPLHGTLRRRPEGISVPKVLRATRGASLFGERQPGIQFRARSALRHFDWIHLRRKIDREDARDTVRITRQPYGIGGARCRPPSAAFMMTV